MSEELSGYTLGTSGRDELTRQRKAAKIIALLEEQGLLAEATVLEVGTGAGFIAHALSQHAATVESVDIVDDRQITEGYRHTLVLDERLPFPDSSFDVVVTNHVIEHVANASLHLAEMRRVLRDGGVVYLASPNKWWLTDPHYKLPFISWLPHPVADRYLRLVRHRRWDIRSLSLRQLKRLSSANGLCVEDKFRQVLTHPQRYGAHVPRVITTAVRLTPGWLTGALLHVAPTHLKFLKPIK